MPKGKKSSDLSSVFYLIIATAVSALFWFLPLTWVLLYPFRLFVTFIHEGGHALAAILTDGTVEQLVVYANASGETYTRGGHPLLIASAGYLTSCAYGATLLALSRYSHLAERMLSINSFVIIIVTFAFSDDPFTLALGSVISFGLFVAALSRLFFCHFLLNFLAVQCCINAILDLQTLINVSRRTGIHSDALIMEKVTLIPAWLWAFAWACLSGLFLLLGLYIYSRSGSGRK
ncbi:MAG: M50 family metallopeptidase [Acidobacteriota bacterium]|jgi:hypothetical protein